MTVTDKNFVALLYDGSLGVLSSFLNQSDSKGGDVSLTLCLLFILATSISRAIILHYQRPLAAMNSKSQPPISITDIRRSNQTEDLIADIQQGLASQPRTLPSLLLWDAEGHKAFKRITQGHSYYGTHADRDIMTQNVTRLCEMIGYDGILLELGSGYVSTKARINCGNTDWTDQLCSK